ncbi:MAG TPA: hypothetical protein VLM37_05140, partial [Fibrobacteraceae bacterium]|nr:hypothetical protein [Fibrobacteraceae bacterium]
LIEKSGNVVLLEGNRRSGKTSILKNLEGKATIPGWLCVYHSMQGSEGHTTETGVPTEEVFRSMATAIASALRTNQIDCPLPDGSLLPANQRRVLGPIFRRWISAEAPFQDFQEYLQLVLEYLQHLELGIVLMMDEFDKLQQGIENHVTSPQVPENMRYLVQNNSHFSILLTGSRKMKKVREDYWSPLFGLGTRLGVSSLDLVSAQRLVQEPVQTMLRYSGSAVDRILQLTACQPFLLQNLCNSLFLFAKRNALRVIQTSHVNENAQKLCEDPGLFQTLWLDYVGTDRKRLILMICNHPLTSNTDLEFEEIREELSQRGLLISSQNLSLDLEDLRDLETLSFHQNKYQLAVPLLGVWMDAQQDLSDLLAKAIEQEGIHE